MAHIATEENAAINARSYYIDQSLTGTTNHSGVGVKIPEPALESSHNEPAFDATIAFDHVPCYNPESTNESRNFVSVVDINWMLMYHQRFIVHTFGPNVMFSVDVGGDLNPLCCALVIRINSVRNFIADSPTHSSHIRRRYRHTSGLANI